MARHATKLAMLVIATLALVLGLAFTTLASSWTDVPDSLLASYGVTHDQVANISTGFPDGSFRPYQNISRAQFVKMADAAFGIASINPSTPTFSDVAATSMYYGYIESASAAHLVNGVGAGLFGPDRTLTREQAVAIIAREVAAHKGVSLAGMTDADIYSALTDFGDAAAVSSSLRAEMAFAVTNGIVKGSSSGDLGPKALVNRLAAAVLLIRAEGSSSASPAPTITSLSPSGGPIAGGTTVIITGANLAGATAVMFGSTAAASFTVNLSTQITAVSPAHAAGTVDVLVTTASGTSVNTTADDFTYTASSAGAAITGLNPSTGPIAGGTTVVITGANLSGATAVKFGSTAASSFTVNSSTQITAVSPAHAAGTVDVSVTTASGTSTNTTADDFTFGSGPSITSLNPAGGPVGGGTTVIIAGTNLSGASVVMFGSTAAASFAVNSSTQITAVTPAHAAGTVDVSVTTSNGTNTNTVADNFTFGAVDLSGATIAAITDQTYTGSALTPTPAVAYNGTTLTVGTDYTVAYASNTKVGTATVTVTGTGSYSGTASATFQIVKATPTVSAWPTASAITSGQALSASTLTGGSATVAGSFAFTNPSTVPATAGAYTASVTFTPTDSADYHVVTGTVQVTVNAAGPPVVSSVSPADGKVAGGTTVTIAGSGFTGASAVSFGGTAATSFTVDSDTQITAVAPGATLAAGKAAKTVSVSVITGGGTSADTTADHYMYFTFTMINGSITKSYSLSDLKALASVSGYWGPHKDLPEGANHYYTGVPLSALLADVGGLPAGHGLNVSTADNFACSYDATRLAQMTAGTYQMWKVSDGTETTGSVQMVLAWQMDGGPIFTPGDPNKDNGPVRVVLMRPTADMLTEGKYSPYLVTSVQVQ